MIKIQDVIDFIGSKRPQYKMENWKNIEPIKTNFQYLPFQEKNTVLSYYNDNNNKEGEWLLRIEESIFFKKVYFKNGDIKTNNDFEEIYDKNSNISQFSYDKKNKRFIGPNKDEYGNNLGYINKNNKLEGEWLIFERHSNFKKKVFFKNGEIVKSEKKNGFEIYYDDKEIPYYLIHGYFFKPFIDKSGNELGYFNDNGKLEGKWYKYSNNSKLLALINYKNGLKDLKTINFYPNGNIYSEGNYLNDKKDGEWLIYNEMGIITERSNYENDILEGEWIKYYDNGEKELKGEYINNKRNGLWVQFFENGNIATEGNFINDLPSGKFKYYDEDGNFKKSQTF